MSKGNGFREDGRQLVIIDLMVTQIIDNWAYQLGMLDAEGSDVDTLTVPVSLARAIVEQSQGLGISVKSRTPEEVVQFNSQSDVVPFTPLSNESKEGLSSSQKERLFRLLLEISGPSGDDVRLALSGKLSSELQETLFENFFLELANKAVVPVAKLSELKRTIKVYFTDTHSNNITFRGKFIKIGERYFKIFSSGINDDEFGPISMVTAEDVTGGVRQALKEHLEVVLPLIFLAWREGSIAALRGKKEDAVTEILNDLVKYLEGILDISPEELSGGYQALILRERQQYQSLISDLGKLLTWLEPIMYIAVSAGNGNRATSRLLGLRTFLQKLKEAYKNYSFPDTRDLEELLNDGDANLSASS